MKQIFATLLLVLGLAMPASAYELGDDGLHKAPWQHDTFRDIAEDVAEANAQGKRMVMIVEQRGCIYCDKMYNEVFVDPEIEALLEERFFVVQVNMFGDIEMTDTDGEMLSEKDAMRKWGVLFTPTMIFMPAEIDPERSAHAQAVAVMPGAFGRHTTFNLLNWVLEEGYNGEENFQKYHARMLETQLQSN